MYRTARESTPKKSEMGEPLSPTLLSFFREGLNVKEIDVPHVFVVFGASVIYKPCLKQNAV